MIFRSRKKLIQDELESYRGLINGCVAELYRTLKRYSETSDRRELKKNIEEVSRLEGAADDKRRSIQVVLYSKSLFPESRGDLLGLLETIDKIANRAEATALMLRTHHISIPESFRKDIVELCHISQRAVSVVLEAERKLFSDFRGALEFIGRVNELESDADHLEHRTINKIFASSTLEPLEKILLRDVVSFISSLADKAEDVGDRIRVIVAKRGV